jgi:mannose/fructose/N-acetylgalactosamine-specific phosphotransferase system component IIC
MFAACTFPCVESCWRRFQKNGVDQAINARRITLGPLWTGLILPLAIFLPISFAAIPSEDQHAMKIVVCVMVVLSWSIAVHLWRQERQAPFFIWGFYIAFVGVPWGGWTHRNSC